MKNYILIHKLKQRYFDQGFAETGPPFPTFLDIWVTLKTCLPRLTPN